METLNYKVLEGTGYNGYILKDAPVKVMQFGEGNFLRAFVVNGVGFIPTPVGGKDNKQVHRVGDCVAIGNLRTVIWRAWDVCMKI